jgi:hypothetical protein
LIHRIRFLDGLLQYSLVNLLVPLLLLWQSSDEESDLNNGRGHPFLRPMSDAVGNSERVKTSAVSKERGWTNVAVFFGDINSRVTDAASTVFRRCAANEASYG